jgi:hypothetical protein
VSSEHIEMLLERLVTVNEAILDKLEDIKCDVGIIKEELNWVGENTYAQVVANRLHEIQLGIIGIESNTSSL